MGRVALDLYKKKLAKLLGITEDAELAWLIWCVNTLQSSTPERASSLISYPPEAVTQEYGSPYFSHPWRMETILNEALTTPKIKTGQYYQRKFLCESYNAIAILSNAINKVENEESGISLRYLDVMREMHRLAQRQFEWQRGFANLGIIYRSSFIFGGSLSRERFQKRRGIDLDTFSRCCFVLMASWYSRPVLPSRIDLSVAELKPQDVSQTLAAISLAHNQARTLASNIRSLENQVAYKPSILRQYPVIRFGDDGEHAICPLPQLLASRATSGLYYDLIGGKGNVTNEISGNFERYCHDLLGDVFDKDLIERGHAYTNRGNTYESFDLAILKNEELAVIIECKATKLTYAAKFSEFPMDVAEEKYSEIIKGVFQIWRYASHLRRGIAPYRQLSPDPVGVVLTLDSWLMMSTPMQKDVISRATSFSKKEDPLISPADRIPVIFCPIDDLEIVCSKSTPSSLLKTLLAATQDKYYGWMLNSVYQDICPDEQFRKPYPFQDRLSEVAPWWRQMQEIMERGRGRA